MSHYTTIHIVCDECGDEKDSAEQDQGIQYMRGYLRTQWDWAVGLNGSTLYYGKRDVCGDCRSRLAEQGEARGTALPPAMRS